MLWIDSWGNEYKTKLAAKKGIRKICLNSPDLWETIGEYMCIPYEVMTWIRDPKRWSDFLVDFHDEIEGAIKDWCDYHYEELEQVEE